MPPGEVEQFGGPARDREGQRETVHREGFLGHVAVDDQVGHLSAGAEQTGRQQLDRDGQGKPCVVVPGTGGHPLGTTVGTVVTAVRVHLHVGDGEQCGPRASGPVPEKSG